MKATVGLRAAQGRLVAKPVQIDVTAARVHIAAAIVSWLQPFEPKDAVHDGGIRPALRGEADGLALFKDRADRMPGADFLSNAVKAERCSIGIHGLANPEGGSRDAIAIAKSECRKPGAVRLARRPFKKAKALRGHAGAQQEAARTHAGPLNGPGEFPRQPGTTGER